MNQRSVIMMFHPTSSPYDDEGLGTDWVAGGLAIKFCEAVTLQPQQLLWVCPNSEPWIVFPSLWRYWRGLIGRPVGVGEIRSPPSVCLLTYRAGALDQVEARAVRAQSPADRTRRSLSSSCVMLSMLGWRPDVPPIDTSSRMRAGNPRTGRAVSVIDVSEERQTPKQPRWCRQARRSRPRTIFMALPHCL
jgi:hypothetical protein